MRIALVHHEAAPPARRKRAQNLRHALERRGHVVSCHDTQTFMAGRDAPDADLICICGGDGTVRLVLDRQESLDSLPPVAIYPVGTINLLARELDYPRDPQAFAARIEQVARLRRGPVARINGMRFFACASMGVDALAVARVSLSLKARIGRFAYVHSIAGMIRRWPRHRFEVIADGERFEAEGLFILRGRYYAGPWTLDRSARIDSDTLHVIALPRVRRSDVLRLGLYAITGARRPDPDWRFLQVSRLQIISADSFPAQADGDILTSTPVEMAMTGETVRWA